MVEQAVQIRESLAKMFILLTVFLALVAVVSASVVIRAINKEEICSKQASRIVDNDWNKPVKVSVQEANSIPFMRSAMSPDYTVFWGVKEQLICEKNFKYFYFI